MIYFTAHSAGNLVLPRSAAAGGEVDLCAYLGLPPTPAGILLGVKGVKRGDMTLNQVIKALLRLH